MSMIPKPQIGCIWPSERYTWKDPEFGRTITQWTNHAYPSWHLYFNIESFIDNKNVIIFSERTGSTNLFKLSLDTGEMLQMTDETSLGSVWHWPQLHTVWYISSNELCMLNTTTLARRVITQLPHSVSGLTATCDGRWVLVSWNKAQSEGRHGPFAVFRIDVQTGEIVQVSPDYGFTINHLQASPTNPNLIIHAWQHNYQNAPAATSGTAGNTPIRIWWLGVDGTDGGPVGPQEFGLHRTHDFWFPCGTRLGYSARYHFGPHLGRQFLGSCLPDGSDNYMFELPVGASHPMVWNSGLYWIADLLDREPILSLSEVQDRHIEHTEKLFRHDSSWQGQISHPHPRISPDGRLVVFGTDRSGVGQVYSIQLNLQ